MAYLIDRQRALAFEDVVAVVKRQERRQRSRVILADNSLYQTLTRPATLMARAGRYPELVMELGAHTRGEVPRGRKGVTWRKPQ